MIGILPKTLTVNGKERAINYDWVTCYNIMSMLQDTDFKEHEKTYGVMDMLFCDGAGSFTEEELSDAVEEAVAFLDGPFHRVEDNGSVKKNEPTKLIDWQQDEPIIMSAIISSVGFDIRTDSSMHWWTFLSFFSEIPAKSTFSFVINIREKVFKGKKLEAYEKDFVKKNKNLIYFNTKKQLTAEERRARNELKDLIGI